MSRRVEVLRRQLNELELELRREHLEGAAVQLAERRTRHPERFAPVDDHEWETLLPRERRRLLPRRWLTVRDELWSEASQPHRLRSIIDQPLIGYINVAASVAGMSDLIYHGLHSLGILAHEQDMHDPIPGASPVARGFRATRENDDWV